MTERNESERQNGVPRIAELRQIAQGAKTRGDRRWTYRIFRHVSIYVTWAVLHTPVTPNQVTVASIVIAGAGLMLVGVSAPGVAIVGCALLLIYHLLDRVDGEVARYRGIYSLHGIYLDNAGHYLTGAGLLIAASFRLAPLSVEPQAIWLLGSIGAIATVLSRVEKHAAFHLFGQYILERPGLVRGLDPSGGFLTREATKANRSDDQSESNRRRGGISFVRDVILTLTNFPITTLLFMLAFSVEAATGATSLTITVLYVVVALQIVAYAGIEFANLTQNLGAESRRLAHLAGLLSDDSDD